MTPDHSPRWPWVLALPRGPASKDVLADLVDEAGGSDDAENEYYEEAANPRADRIERAQRRYRGAFLRRARRRPARLSDDT